MEWLLLDVLLVQFLHLPEDRHPLVSVVSGAPLSQASLKSSLEPHDMQLCPRSILVCVVQ